MSYSCVCVFMDMLLQHASAWSTLDPRANASSQGAQSWHRKLRKLPPPGIQKGH